MTIAQSIRKHWVTSTMYVAFSAFFLCACLVSANTYGAIAQAQRDICLLNPQYDAEIGQKGRLNISFSVQLHNPSRYALHVSTLSWYAKLENLSSPDKKIIPVGEEYIGPTEYMVVRARTTVNYTFWSVITDPGTRSELLGFVNYSRSLGENYTLETLPYVHSFTVMLTIGEFQHDYLREGYLNDLVTVRLAYSSTEGAP